MDSSRARKRMRRDVVDPSYYTTSNINVNPMVSQDAFSIQQPPSSHTLFGQSLLSNVSLGGYNLLEAQLHIPLGLAQHEEATLHSLVTHELQNQPLPVLPTSTIPPLPPKPRAQPWHEFPKDVTSEIRRDIEEKNNRIAARNQRVERERNNMAAKKSRQVRIEALANSRTMLNRQAAEITWLRLQVLLLGGSLARWDDMPDEIKDGMVEDVGRRVDAIETRNAEVKKRQESKHRAEKGRRLKSIEEDANDESGGQDRSMSPEYKEAVRSPSITPTENSRVC
ncbi:hypothetical protein B0I35DRAFT_472702 [Stachybotrys elegans]|uniref:BZIP domain-containing protein n=1 Tax=Stachybotrys elegans TaxID=80388 RepID=A0A8K0T5U5_9HYPO|nr:hypothetical protein B0I35DRAFT_472702 [Stachybotrys elegans]